MGTTATSTEKMIRRLNRMGLLFDNIAKPSQMRSRPGRQLISTPFCHTSRISSIAFLCIGAILGLVWALPCTGGYHVAWVYSIGSCFVLSLLFMVMGLKRQRSWVRQTGKVLGAGAAAAGGTLSMISIGEINNKMFPPDMEPNSFWSVATQ